MANDFYKDNWKTFLKCKQCNVFKELNDNNWYKHNEWFLWVLWRCKECILAWRKTEYELSMARVRDKNRYHNNIKRREYIYKSAKERKLRHLDENPNWVINHWKTDRVIKKLWIRPLYCPICWYEWRIIAHHPDINKWNEIIFCCQICHDKIHKWKLICDNILDLTNSLLC